MTSATCMQVPTTTTMPARPAAAAATAGADPCVASAGIVGGSGYTGALLAELLLKHPSVKLAAISSETLAGDPVQQHLPRLRSDLYFCSQADLGGVDVAFLCTPHGDAAPIAKKLLDDGVKVIDLSADFRLDAATYAEWYGEHPHPELLPGVYGLTELHRDEVAGADLVANPGCYPTAALLALAPLKQLGLADVIIDAKSGVSGAGKTPKSTTHFCSVDSDLVAYGVQSHRHYPEIAAGLGGGARQEGPRLGAERLRRGAGAAGPAPSLTFVPHLVPLQRGISETIYVKTATLPLPSAGRAQGALRRLLRGRDLRRGVRRAAAAQGRGRHQLLPDLPARGRPGRPDRRHQRHRQPDEGRLRPGRAEHERHARPARARRAGLRCCPSSRFAPLPPFARTIGGGLTAPQGFLAAGVASGVKKRGKLDLGLLLSEQPAVSAATFTSNAAAAAPVRLTRETSDCGHLRAVVVNAGNANACTGKQGLADAARMRLLTANHLRLPVEQVAVCSTGLIGVHLPMDKIEPGIAAAAAALPAAATPRRPTHFSTAIRTTDKHAK